MEPERRGRPSAGRIFGYSLMLLGLFLVIWPAHSYVAGLWHQARLVEATVEALPGAEEPQLAAGEVPTPEEPTVALPAPSPPDEAEPAPAPSQPRMLLEIPSLSLRQAVLEGIDNHSLDRGPGHYPRTSLPDREGSNTAIAGHRTIRGVPSFFYHLNQLEAGDSIRLTYGGVLYRYAVEQLFIVDPQDTYVLNPVGYTALTLTTCDPPGTDERRLIVRARLVGQEPAS